MSTLSIFSQPHIVKYTVGVVTRHSAMTKSVLIPRYECSGLRAFGESYFMENHWLLLFPYLLSTELVSLVALESLLALLAFQFSQNILVVFSHR